MYAGQKVAGVSHDEIDMVLAEAGYGGPGPSAEDDMELLNLANRRHIAAVANDVSINDGARYGENNFYNEKAGIGKPKCNIYVRDVQRAAGAATPKFPANEWGNSNSDIPNWRVVPTAEAGPGDVIAYSRPGHGHVGIVTVGGANPSALAASLNGVVVNKNFWNPPAGSGNPVVWRWTGN
jgi:hypothetical protein